MEQVISAGLFLSRLLGVTPQLSLLITRRMPLHISGEFEYLIAPLSNAVKLADGAIGDGKISPAMALFITRARLVRPDLELSEVNLKAIGEICRRLDGLPLAIELAAARFKVVSPTALLSRLSNSLQVLTGGPVDAPLRLRSFRDAIRWSYDLLSPYEQLLLRGAGIFRGGFSVEAFAKVTGLGDDGLDYIGALVDRSLFNAIQTAEEELRITILETFREFALDELTGDLKLEELSARHAEWVRLTASVCYADFFGPQETAAMNRLEREPPNINGALEWLVRNNPEIRSCRRLVPAGSPGTVSGGTELASPNRTSFIATRDRYSSRRSSCRRIPALGDRCERRSNGTLRPIDCAVSGAGCPGASCARATGTWFSSS